MINKKRNFIPGRGIPGFPIELSPIPGDWGILGIMQVLGFFIPIPAIPGKTGNGNGNSREIFIPRTSLVEEWYKEYLNYSKEHVWNGNIFHDEQIGHFLQVRESKNTKIFIIVAE